MEKHSGKSTPNNFETLVALAFETLIFMAAFKKFFGTMYFHFRYFDGGLPTLVTTDLEIAKQVLIKDFNKFHAREVSAQTMPTSTKITCYFDECEGSISHNEEQYFPHL